MSSYKNIRLMDIQDLLKKNGIKDLEKLHKAYVYAAGKHRGQLLSLIHISEPTRPY